MENNDNSKISQSSASTVGSETQNKEAPVAQELEKSAQKKPEKKPAVIKVPDLFKNVKIKKPNYLKYPRV